MDASQLVTLCLGCQQPLRTYEQSGRLHGECVNKHCRRVWITREIAELQTLSNADLDAMGFGDWSEKKRVSTRITRDGELLATLGFTVEQLADDEFSVDDAFVAAGGDLTPHSGYSWGCARSVAAVLVKHGWKTVDEIPLDHELQKRLINS